MVQRSNLIYENYTVLSPAGNPLFKCSQKKFNWYLKRDLASLIEDKVAILKIDPKGDGYGKNSFLLSDRNNECVVCGETDINVLSKHHVVPYCYKKYFPVEFKNNNHYDVLPLCRSCHDVYEKDFAPSFREELKHKYGFKPEKNVEVETAIKYAKALVKNTNIPLERRTYMYNKIYSYFAPNVSLDKVADMSVEYPNEYSYVSSRIEDYNDFFFMCRKHFIDTMKPKFLPKGWSVNERFVQ